VKSRSCVLAPRVCGTELRQAEDTLKLYKRSDKAIQAVLKT
jgi:hypothetical protein